MSGDRKSEDLVGDILGTLVFWPFMFIGFGIGTWGGILLCVGVVALILAAIIS